MISSVAQAKPEAAPWEPRSRLLDPGPRFEGSTHEGARPHSCLTRRGVLYEYVRAHPGAHVRLIGKDLGLANGDLQYHMLWLEKHGYVRTRRDGFYRLVYPAMIFEESQEVMLGLLNQETPRELLLWLTCEPGATQRDLATKLSLSQPTISWHMERLIERGIATKARTERGVSYRITADLAGILSLVKTYHPGVWRRWAPRLAGVAAQSAVLRRPEVGRALVAPAPIKLIGGG